MRDRIKMVQQLHALDEEVGSEESVRDLLPNVEALEVEMTAIVAESVGM